MKKEVRLKEVSYEQLRQVCEFVHNAAVPHGALKSRNDKMLWSLTIELAPKLLTNLMKREVNCRPFALKLKMHHAVLMHQLILHHQNSAELRMFFFKLDQATV